MKIGIIYLGRRGYGAVMALEATLAITNITDGFAVVSSQVENLPLWRQINSSVFYVGTYKNDLQALVSLIFTGPIRKVASIVREMEPTILLFPMFHPWNAILQSLLPGIPSVIFVHDPLPHPGLIDWIYHQFQWQSLKRASQCVLPSSIFRERLINAGIPGSKIAVMPLPASNYYQKYFHQNDKELPIPTRLLFFGRITPYKGINILLDAFKAFEQSRMADLIIAGEGNLKPYQHHLEELKHVQVFNRWIGDSEIPVLFQPGTVVVLPYLSATQSGVIELAASFSLPVIASRVGGIPEQIIDGETGLLVDPGNSDQLKMAIERLINDAALSRKLGQTLHDQNEQKNSWELAAGKILILCQSVSSQVASANLNK